MDRNMKPTKDDPPPPFPPPPPKLYGFSTALEALKQGRRVARLGWNGKGMWLCYVHPGNAALHGFDMQPCVGMKTADNKMQPGWLASQNDLLSEDWVILDDDPPPPFPPPPPRQKGA